MTPAREHILALVSDVPSSRRYARLLCMLQGYFDGSTEHGKVLVVAGYLATVNTWLRFSDEWAELLALPPRMKAFKMKDAARNQMERAMFHYRVIERTNLLGIACAIPIEPLVKVVDELGLEPGLKNPYYLAWRAVITLALEGSKLIGSREPIEFIFDDQSEKVNIIKAWDYYKNGARRTVRKRIIGAPSFKSDDDVVALQAADLLAWWARKQYLTNKDSVKDLFPKEWTGGKEPHLFFADLPEQAIRTQLTKDVAIMRLRNSPLSMSATFHSVPSSGRKPLS